MATVRPVVRQGGPQDVDAVMRLRWEVFDYVRTFSEEEWDESFGDSLREALAYGTGCLFVADDPQGDGVVSSAAGLLFRGLAKPRSRGFFVKVSSVATSEAYRRMGLAREAMQGVVDWAAGHGCDRLMLNSSEEGRLLYGGLGFLGNESAMELRLPQRTLPVELA